MFTCCETPYILAFMPDGTPVEWLIIEGLIDVFFLVDVIINFFTSYYNNEFALIDDRRVIFILINVDRLLQKNTSLDGS
jgi:hypothetical protein